MIGSELRNWYLGTLGIVRYIPRGSNSAADTEFERENEPDTESVTESAPRSRQQHSLRQLLDNNKPAMPSQTQPAVRKASMSRKEDTGSGILHCRLAFWQPSRDMAVVSSLAVGDRPTPAQLTMLSRLLKAIGQLESSLPTFDLIDWPQAPGTSATVQDAREFLSVFLDAKAFLEPYRQLLVMGDVSARLVMPDDSQTIGCRAILPCGAEGVVTHSLSEMEQDPALKAPTWEAIKFLASQ